MKKLILILALSSLCVAGQRVVSLSISNRIVMIAPSKDTVFVIVDTTPKPSKINWDSLSYWLDEDINGKKSKSDTTQEKITKMQEQIKYLSGRLCDVEDMLSLWFGSKDLEQMKKLIWGKCK